MSTMKDSPRLILRTYKTNDHAQVDHLFYSTYFSLVPVGVKSKLKSPVVWTVWILVYSYLMAIVPVLLSGLNTPAWASIVLKIFLTVSWTIVSFAGIFVVTDRFEVVDKVEQARQNDLSDPEIYYLNWTKEEVEVEDTLSNDSNKKRVTFDKEAKPATEIIRQQKPLDQHSPSHFWVLILDNKVCGMIGLAHYTDRIFSRKAMQPPAYKLICTAILKRYGFPLPSFLTIHPQPPTVFAEPTPPKTAILQRWAVKIEFQECGLSTLLVDRAMSWAYEQSLDTVIAVTNEFETKAASILQRHHGFQLIHQKKGWWGQNEKTWSCDVKEWMKHHETAANTYFLNKS